METTELSPGDIVVFFPYFENQKVTIRYGHPRLFEACRSEFIKTVPCYTFTEISTGDACLVISSANYDDTNIDIGIYKFVVLHIRSMLYVTLASVELDRLPP